MKGMQEKGVLTDDRYRDRLQVELKEVNIQADHEYLTELYDKCRTNNLIFPENENNNLVDWLLGLTNEFDIDQPSRYVQGEFPDIDIDFFKEVRDYMKRVWAPEKFGQENICEIGTYTTVGIKSAILDMTRVHGEDKSEIQAITVKMEDKDEEGDPLEWDKALEIYPEFAAFCEKHPQIAKAAREMIDRNKSGGVHAGGLVISSKRLDGFVPLEVRMVNKKNPNGVICSAWTEGLSAQDLQPMGLIKFDLLVINNLKQIAWGCKLVKERHGIEYISALPGQWDWSDTAYLNDPKSIEMANKADIKCIFQFDSEGMRRLVKRGGVTSFDDLVAYSALYRPGPLNCGMDARYCKRKKHSLNPNDPDGEPYNIHPVMEPILGKTYGVMAYQEQIMDILRVVGKIPAMHTEKVRKAISKKKVDQFMKYKEMFIENGQETLRVNKEYVEDLWRQIESFAEYGFNLSHACAYTYISARLLWLKVHYPLEFYTSIMMCETDDEKFREYKLDARNHGVEICPVHINKSKDNFNIEDGKIYFGFKNIKNIGEEDAQRIVENQPYESFRDFLDKFGTDLKVIKALIAIGVFEEDYDRIELRKFAEHYKDHVKKRRDRQKRYEASLEKKKEELREMLLTEVDENDPDFEEMCEFTEQAECIREDRFVDTMRQVKYKSKGVEKTKEVSLFKQLSDIARKRQNLINSFQEKERYDDENPLSLDQFNSSTIKLSDEETKVLKSERQVNGEISYPEAEKMYYGFEWVHELETSPDYTGTTLDKFLEEAEMEGVSVGMVELRINGIRNRTSKRGTKFLSVDVEDSNSKKMTINVWKDDSERWEEEFKAGKLLKIRVRPPNGGFNTLTFDSVPKRERHKLPPKEDDPRIVVMRSAPEPKKEEEILDNFVFDEDAVRGLEGLE